MKRYFILLFVFFIFLSNLKANKFQTIDINEYKNLYQITLSLEEKPIYVENVYRNPYRIVVDLKNTIIVPSKKKINIDREPFKEIRIAQHDKNTVRFVLELTKKLTHTISQKDNQVIVSIKYLNENKINTVKKKVPVKLAPRNSSVTISEVSLGTKIKVINEKNGWYLVLLNDKQVGWINKSSLKISNG